RPNDRKSMVLEAVHAFTMLSRPAEALRMLAEIKPDDGSAESGEWHACASAALERAGNDNAALVEAKRALAGYIEEGADRKAGNAHRLIAIAAWKLGDRRTADAHLHEAERIIERHGTPYGMLRLMVARADITGRASHKA